MPTIAVIAGTRPEVIKMAPVYFALQRSKRLRPVFLSTAQHRQMLDQAMAAFGLTPEFDLNLMQPGQTLTDLTARVLVAVGRFLEEQKPAAILVQGDTTTVLASTLAAFYARIPVGHVEAGLRTYNFEAPWPEEMNRRLADPISRWCFAPTEASRANLVAERIPAAHCHVTGNTVIDALLWMRDRLYKRGVTASEVAERCRIPAAFAGEFLVVGSRFSVPGSRFSVPGSRFFDGGTSQPKNEGQGTNNPSEAGHGSQFSVAGSLQDGSVPKNYEQGTNNPNSQRKRWLLVTGHRRESFGGGFENICRAILNVTEQFPDVGILYPVHLNPHVQEPVNRLLGGNPRIALIPPVGYEDFIWLLDHCTFVLSDSGGVQEEAPSLGKPVLVMRETTERPEGVSAGTCRLVGTDPETILRECAVLLNDRAEYQRRSELKNPYGDGRAAERIVRILEEELG